ncbi:winged helix-turn-helix domain-containing protein [Halosimplex aquaticum]|uniref:Winged helix-turn-helix domain-containing protein n=1 Tax=Halosimplex aquaticum TaxID=3026162 RepID=A0ABD5XV23_9EURY|nr:helix-turn-helix domain-containing protein [Halosimplex aquaticum]
MVERGESRGVGNGDGSSGDSGPDDDRGGRTATGRADPTAVFELLADETRLAIVRELAAERQSNWQWAGATFAELRRAVGVEDAGNFSYHLEKLCGPLVVKDGDEYHLRNRGVQLVGAVESGRYTGPGDPFREEVAYDCPHSRCDRSLVGVYDDQYFRIRCPDHDVFNGTALPPVAADHHTTAELVEITMLDLRQQVQRAKAGVCPNCWGPIEGRLPATDTSLSSQIDADIPEDALLAAFDCQQCGISFDLPPGACVVEHTAVMAFYQHHDEPIRGRPYVDLPFCHLGRGVLESDDPVRVRVDVELDGDVLRLWLDGETNVVEYERE